MTIGMQTLKHTKFYWVGTERVQFKAETETSSYFKVSVAKFIFPGKEVLVKTKPFSTQLENKDQLPFDIEYVGGNWKAPLREAI